MPAFTHLLLARWCAPVGARCCMQRCLQAEQVHVTAFRCLRAFCMPLRTSLRSHDWAEAWADGRWHFLDPDGSKTLDDGWFKTNTQMQTVHEGDYLNHSIVASSYASTFTLPTGLYPDSSPISHFPMVWDWQNNEVGGWDVTGRYLRG